MSICEERERTIREIVQLLHAGRREEALSYQDDQPWCLARAQEQYDLECWKAEREESEMYIEQHRQYKEDLANNRWCMYVPEHERPVLGALLKLCLLDGNRCSIWDGEEYVISRSNKWSLLKSRLGHTGEDVLVVWDSDGNQLGQFNLIYNNGSKDHPMVVICDHTDNAFCDDIVTQLEQKYGER